MLLIEKNLKRNNLLAQKEIKYLNKSPKDNYKVLNDRLSPPRFRPRFICVNEAPFPLIQALVLNKLLIKNCLTRNQFTPIHCETIKH